MNKNNRVVLIIILIALVLSITTIVICFIFAQNRESSNEQIEDIEEEFESEDNIVEDDEDAVIDDEEASEEVEAVDDNLQNIETEEIQAKEENSTERDSSINEEVSNSQDNQNNTETIDYEEEYNKFVEALLETRYIYVFETSDEAKNFGDSVAKTYGFSYEYGVRTFELNGTKRNVYVIKLYAKSNMCEDNQKVYVDRDQDLMDVYRYLEKYYGYSCPEKTF